MGPITGDLNEVVFTPKIAPHHSLPLYTDLAPFHVYNSLT